MFKTIVAALVLALVPTWLDAQTPAWKAGAARLTWNARSGFAHIRPVARAAADTPEIVPQRAFALPRRGPERTLQSQ